MTLPNYPTSGNEAVERPAKPKAPVTVKIAFSLSLLSAIGFAVGGLLYLRQENAILQGLSANHPKGLQPSQYATYAKDTVVVVAVTSVLFAVFYLLLDLAMLSGRNWARITMTVLVVLGIVANLLGGIDWATLIFLVVALLTVAMLYMPTSSEFFTAAKRARLNRS
ncbi:MAG TPA: hypothetical protein VG317_04820 [Pseudonocardiaceae bacterium]|nr:hypothetical protein [Pseudonocardiaceae bacterium]